MKILLKATRLDNFPEYTPQAAPNLKKDKKYYNLIAKQKASFEKSQKQDRFSKFNGKRALDSKLSLQIPNINTVAHSPVVLVSPATVPKFAVNTYVSISPDTSQRGYKCNRIQGRVSAINLSPDGSTFIYDIHKIVDGYILRPRRIENNSIKIN